MSKIKSKYTIFLILAIVIVGCTNISNSESERKSEINFQKPNYKNVTVDELHEQLKNKDFILVDVHIPEQKHINGTDAFIPYDEIENQLENLPKDKDAKIVLYCRTGRMSEIAAEKLAENGYTNVYNVVGGVVEWIKRGYDKQP
ncbi:rhodanese-like domain-containing protein [Candidatus Woesearchaeota archaeon]|nr:rhodanese-like domain-containing protein [Candidatus Woesearchaeota archaeon]